MAKHAVAAIIGKRLVALVALMLLLSVTVFSLVYLAPGDPVKAYLGGRPATPETVDKVREQFNLDKSFTTQYWLWLKDALSFRFGTSTKTTLPVTEEIGARLGSSVFLATYAYVLMIVLGVVGGAIAALHQRKAVDRVIVAVGVVAVSTPPFVMGVALLYLFAVVVPVFPAAGVGEGIVDRLWHLTLPALALALSVAAFLLRHTREAMINVLNQDYILFARARGLSRSRVLTRYAIRNALIPIVTVSGAMFAYFFSGAVLVEATFSLGGVGELLVQSAQASDLPVIQALVLLIATLIVIANLAADLAYMAIDPRIRLGDRST